MRVLFMAGLLAFSGTAGAGDRGHDYPTHERVRYVYECMATNGGRSFGNMYKCSCAIDYVAEHLPYEKFVEAETYVRGRRARGERGGVLREGERAESVRERFQALEQEAY
ncbi:MAG: hypothetical protein GWN84_03230, partial [Gammaproteobacteria bacterium]|nr:hypothetical protein [Gammaproteobacteria bacterium]NIR59532.1 hypothetical protein [Gammaproteobacteria bacterium]